jgi:hypothetical protein
MTEDQARQEFDNLLTLILNGVTTTMRHKKNHFMSGVLYMMIYNISNQWR